MKITKHAQSCLLIETKESRVLIDPGTYVFKEEGLKPEDFDKIDIIAFTHEHSDHFDLEAVKTIIKINSPKILAPKAVADQLGGTSNIQKVKPGFEKEFNDITVECFSSKHGPLPDGTKPPEVVGILIDDGKKRLYTPGDSLFIDQEVDAEVIAIPFCGEVTMDLDTAVTEIIKSRPSYVIPIHYDNPRFPANENKFVQEVLELGINARALDWGESINTQDK